MKRFKMKIAVLVIAFLSLCLNCFGQVSDYGSFTETHDLYSKDGRKYTLKITVPKSYNDTLRYKTLYYLDSWWLSETVLGAYALLNLSKQVDDVLLIGISVDGGLKDWNIQRTLDFTPSKYDFELMGFSMRAGEGDDSIELNKDNTGGADAFMEFLETKAINYVENKFPTIKDRRGLIGHSYGGLFGFYAMQKKPTLFSDYIMVSPSLWWNRSEIVNKESYSQLNVGKHQIKLYLTFGGTEAGLIKEPSLAMLTIIGGALKEDFDYRCAIDSEGNHNSILPNAIYDGLLFLYGL